MPALDTGSKVIVESLDICNFLDKEYQNPPLYPSQPLAVEQDKELIQKINPLVDTFNNIILGKEKKSLDEWKNQLLSHLQIFDQELQNRGKKYFGGQNPGMVIFFYSYRYGFETTL